jgi:ubiquinone/menaquinone biosynthesis C-methylase UbiE
MTDQATNHWLDPACARAFWHQHLALPYQELLRDTAAWLAPQPGERWLDLGCGGGQLTSLLWRLSAGHVAEIVALDCNPLNAEALARLQRQLGNPAGERIRFVVGDFSAGLPQFADRTFDGIVSGLAISYAEHRDPATGRYTDQAYNRLLAEMYRVLRPGGRLVFSVNVPGVRFWPILGKSLRLAFRLSKPLKALVNGLRMQAYGHWLRGEARRQRFHYLPIEDIASRLKRLGFKEIQYRLSYAEQAYLVRAR